jgi:hypothetical protein
MSTQQITQPQILLKQEIKQNIQKPAIFEYKEKE